MHFETAAAYIIKHTGKGANIIDSNSSNVVITARRAVFLTQGVKYIVYALFLQRRRVEIKAAHSELNLKQQILVYGERFVRFTEQGFYFVGNRARLCHKRYYGICIGACNLHNVSGSFSVSVL